MAKADSDPRKVAALVALLAILAVVVIYRVRPALVSAVGGAGDAAVRVGKYAVPVIDEVVGVGRTVPTPKAGRSLFTFGPPPTPTPDPRPTPTPAPTLPPRPRPTPTPAGILVEGGRRLPPPPRFTMAYLGWLGPDRLQIAVFRDGEDVVAVPVGETVRSSFVVREVGPADVTIGYVGYPASVSTKVPVSR